MSDYPLARAKYFTAGGNETPTRIVIHRMEAPEKGDSAESCARYFQTLTRPASAHLCCDNNSIVRSVLDGDIAFHAPPNKGSLGIEHAGIGEDWGSGGQFDTDMLQLSAKAVARWCRQYNIPAVWLSPDDLRAGKHGITSHYNVSQAWHQTTHTDGQYFPFAAYLVLVRQNLASPGTQPTTPVSSSTKPAPVPVSAPTIFRNVLNGVPVSSQVIAIPLDADGKGAAPLCDSGKLIALSPWAENARYAGDADTIVWEIGAHEYQGIIYAAAKGGDPHGTAHAWVTVTD